MLVRSEIDKPTRIIMLRFKFTAGPHGAAAMATVTAYRRCLMHSGNRRPLQSFLTAPKLNGDAA